MSKNYWLGLFCASIGTPFGASYGDAQSSDFTSPTGMTISSYQAGVMTGNLAVQEAPNSWQIRGTKRDPSTFKEEPTAPLALSFRSQGHLQAALADNSTMVWETPTRLILIRNGQRVSYTSDSPIVKFSPEFLAADRIILKKFLASHGGEAFSVAALEDGVLVKYSFVRAEPHAANGGASQTLWRWGGAKPSHAGMYEKANLVMTAPFDILLSDSNELVGWNNPTLDTVTIIQGYEGYSTLAQWRGAKVSQPTYTTVTLAAKQLMPMSDHEPLAATILVPGDQQGRPAAGRFPTVLMRTPYGRDHSLSDAFKFVSRGYAVVSQDVRGRGDSAGSFAPVHEDIADGNDTLNWIAKQPWSDGKVGMIGGSYLGWVQWQAAASGNPHLKAMISIVPSFGPFADMPYVNGMFSTGALTWAVFMGSTPEQFAEAMKKDLNAVGAQLPLVDADVRAAGHEIPFWREWVAHSSFDSYWQQGNVLNFQDKIDVPVLHITGWYDDVLRGSMAAYAMMKANHRSNQQLLLGPWPHAVNTVRSLSELSFGPYGVRADMHYGYVRWFDHWLKGIDNAANTDPAVRYFTMGENQWHTADAWPPKSTVKKSWYLQADRNMAMTVPRGSSAPDQYSYDPADPVPYLVDIRANQGSAPEDYQELEHRPDVLVYTTEALEKPFEVTGEAVAVIYAATDRKETDWVVRVTDVFPDGRSINVIDGYLKAGFRNGMAREEFVTPGQVVKYNIPMAWTSYRFAPGHKIHFIIASAAAGLFVVNTNTGNPIGPDIEVKVARQTIYHSAQYPSHIEVSTPQ